ncbi:MAG: efflux RND transporter permease subunit [Pseudomonadota bacterium]
MRHTEFSLRRPVTITMIFAAVTIIGLISTRLIPIEELPDIEFPGFFVMIPYAGSTPEETERLVTRPAEEALATLPGVKNMYSTSRADQTEIWMQYGFNSNAKAEAVEARVKLDAIRDQLPAEVRRILVFSGSLNDEPILTLRVSSKRDLGNEYLLLNRLVKRRLERIEGVSKVELQGVEPPEILIHLDQGRIAAHGVDLEALADLLERSNFAVSAGTITSAAQRVSLRPNGEFASVAAIRDLVINERGLKLGDIAEVTMRSRERTYGRHLDGDYAIGIAVSKATGANMVEVSDRVLAEVDEIGKLPQMRGINIFSLDNNAENVRKSLSDLISAGVIGALLAIVVLYLFLRQMSTTLIVTLAVPLSLLVTISVLYFAGMSINILTLMGLMLAVGLLVDNSVVVTESIFRARQANPAEPTQATLRGVREVGLAVMASTLTSICVFLPIVFGEQIDIIIFLWHVGITISVAIVCSLIVAQTLIPLLASRIAPPQPAKSGSFMERLTRRYVGALGWSLRRPATAGAVAVGVLASIAVPFATGLLKVDMFPQEPSRRLYMPYYIDGTYPVDRVEQAVDRIERYLLDNRAELDIRSVYSYYAETEAATVILLTDEDEATVDAATVMKRIEDELPTIAIGKPSFKWDQQGGGDGFSITLTGDSTERLFELGEEVRRLLGGIDELGGLTSDMTAGDNEIRVIIDRNRAARFGLTSQDVATAVNVALRGRDLREFRTPEGEIGMRVSFRDSDRQSISQVSDMTLIGEDGQEVLLSSVATLDERLAPAQIRRTDRQTSLKISGVLDDDVSMSDIRPKVSRLLDQFALPSGYAWNFGEAFERADETQQVLTTNILLGVALIFIVMAALFESALYPVSIMTSLLYSVVGVIWFLALTGTTMTFMAMIGIMILIGVVVNNGIVLVDHINNLRREGLSREQAVLDGARDRIRPILMTVATTILGLAPLAVGSTQIGGDGPQYYPMARAIIGGLAFSTLASLLVVPLTYVMLDRMRNAIGRTIRLAKSAPGPAAGTTAG